MASPASRLAWATRVRESIIKRTSLPCARKYSAMAVARFAPRIRSKAARSAGTATTHIFLRAAPVMACSTKAPTSRPRSPIKPTTMTSALQNRVIMASKTDLPTPDPATIPTRWPLPIVSREFTERTPTSKGWVMGARSSGLTDFP